MIIQKKPEAWLAAVAKFIPNEHKVSRGNNDLSYQTLEEIEAEMRELGVTLLDYAK